VKQLIELWINGEIHELAVEPQVTLIEVLRGHLGLTGTKEACGTGECGSCTVLADGQPILSCLALALDYQKQDILTIEGLSEGNELTPVQEAFLDCGAVQCGFCTPGMILSVTALLKGNPRPTDEETKKALEGHLCRCTGYNKIIDAVNKAASHYSTPPVNA
jgi:carbon-monoxide dehydrogenase small subunit